VTARGNGRRSPARGCGQAERTIDRLPKAAGQAGGNGAGAAATVLVPAAAGLDRNPFLRAMDDVPEAVYEIGARGTGPASRARTARQECDGRKSLGLDEDLGKQPHDESTMDADDGLGGRA